MWYEDEVGYIWYEDEVGYDMYEDEVGYGMVGYESECVKRVKV